MTSVANYVSSSVDMGMGSLPTMLQDSTNGSLRGRKRKSGLRILSMLFLAWEIGSMSTLIRLNLLTMKC
jgi:hypothetical protein